MASFHFTSSAPDEQLFSSIQNLNNFNNAQLTEFVNILLDVFINHSASDLMDKVGVFAAAHSINLNALKSIVRGVLVFCKGALRSNVSPPHVKDDLVNLGLTEEKADIFSQLWKSSFIAMSRSAIGQTLTVNQVVDMEWRFGVATASDELKKVGSTFLQLKLVLDKGNNQKENVHMELTLPQFYQFLHDMETAKANLDYFS
eukprot:TRINITY_DN2459_c0_g2_i6.p1 TRINITY_DN2459_c0_g2~~TRINITY_DN2459_c0_g2_i6.p1  ORF type:complete len:201 (+),score=46.18 TRINITY_DN2459_c0_g2_i6:164-766(+)